MNGLKQLLERYPALRECETAVQAAFNLLRGVFEQDRILYLCGNGGSAADASHIVGELMKSFVLPRPIPAAHAASLSMFFPTHHLQRTLRAFSLAENISLTTAYANDAAPDLVFAQQVYGYGRKGDALWALSTSGNSANVLRALEAARSQGLKTLGLTGADGGAMRNRCDVCIHVPETETYKVQELHVPVYHALCLMLEQHFFG